MPWNFKKTILERPTGVVESVVYQPMLVECVLIGRTNKGYKIVIVDMYGKNMVVYVSPLKLHGRPKEPKRKRRWLWGK